VLYWKYYADFVEKSVFVAKSRAIAHTKIALAAKVI
jgi:hypothetical protein